MAARADTLPQPRLGKVIKFTPIEIMLTTCISCCVLHHGTKWGGLGDSAASSLMVAPHHLCYLGHGEGRPSGSSLRWRAKQNTTATTNIACIPSNVKVSLYHAYVNVWLVALRTGELQDIVFVLATISLLYRWCQTDMHENAICAHGWSREIEVKAMNCTNKANYLCGSWEIEVKSQIGMHK